jgi:peptidyl-prolyl cis-trans isomerase B (cyclophilin B)
MKKLILSMFIILISFSGFAKKNKNKFVEIETSMGMIKVEVYADVPQHAANFLKLANEGFYDSLLFHRIIPSFMIQGGDPDSKNAVMGQMLGNGDVGYKVPAEFMLPKYYHKKGALAAARDNNPEKASSGCQFYIVVGKQFTDNDLDMMENRGGFKYSQQARTEYKTIGGTPHLDGAYTVYGQVVKGQEVVDAISNAPRNPSDRPNENIRILSMKVKKK